VCSPVYEQFAETILIDVTFSDGIADAGVAVPRALALDEPGADDDPGELDDPGRSAVALWSVVPEPLEPERADTIVPVIWTLWFTCWLRLTPELPADNTYVCPAALLDVLDADELADELLDALSLEPPCWTLVRMNCPPAVALLALESGRDGVVLLRPTVLLPSQLCRHPVTVTVRPLSELDG
jgi:hypothetical protein